MITKIINFKALSIRSVFLSLIFILNISLSTYSVFAPIVDKAQSGDDKWNFIVYIAGNNNLHKFALRSINQMAKIGSNSNINLLVQLDQWGHRKITRYYIEKDNKHVVDSYEATAQSASGSAESLYDCVKWAVNNYKANKTALILWNHGSGILDPHIWGRLMSSDRDDLYYFNPETCMLELDRNALYHKSLPSTMYAGSSMGIAFNDQFETYISNQELTETLERIQINLLNGKKIDLLGMDACHMAMLEVASQVKNSVQYMVASQEIEPGPGWKYDLFLDKLINVSPNPAQLASYIVNAYKQEYINITPDYTQSAFDLKSVNDLEINIDSTAQQLITMMNSEGGEQIFSMLRRVRTNYQYTTAFYNHNYIDLHHFYMSILATLQDCNQTTQAGSMISKLKDTIYSGLAIMKQFVIANVAGPSVKHAFGVSIYFPHKNIHTSYLRTIFAQTTKWVDFLAEFLKRSGRVDTYAHDDQDVIIVSQSDVDENEIIRNSSNEKKDCTCQSRKKKSTPILTT